MPETEPPAGRSRRFDRWWVAAAVLLLVGGASLAAGLEPHHHPLAAPVPASVVPGIAAHQRGAAPKPPTAVVVSRSVPLSLRIPAIGVSVSLSTLGLNPTGTVQVPTDVQVAGWYDLGPSPGQMGSSVILGHVDSFQGPAVFFRLRTLRPGDEVSVTLADGTVATFSVNAVKTFLKSQFPAQLVYGTHGERSLQLVTCGGTFDAATGHYLSNVVVFTTLVTSTDVTRS